MADEQQVLRNVNWNEVFSFTHIFKSFKMAIHPSKQLLCLAALVLMFVTGVVLDTVWSMGGGYVMPDEIGMHATMAPGAFGAKKQAWLDKQRDDAADVLAAARTQYKTLGEYVDAAFPSVGYLKSAFTKERDDRDEGLDPGRRLQFPRQGEKQVRRRSRQDR